MATVVPPIFNELKVLGATPIYNNVAFPYLEFKDSDYKAKYATFDNIFFNELVLFERTNFSIGLKFENCKFKEPLVFIDVRANGYDHVLNPNSESLVFRKCIFSEKVQFSGLNSLIERDVVFDGCTFNKGIEVAALNIELEGLKILNCTIKEKLELQNVKAKADILIANNNVECFTTLGGIESDRLSIIGTNTFHDNVNIKGCKFKQGILFNDGLFKKEFWIRLVETEESGLHIFGSTFEQALIVDHHFDKKQPMKGISDYYFSGTKFNDGAYINGTNPAVNMVATSPIVNYITLLFTQELKGNIVFRNLDVGILHLTGYNNSANVILETIDVNQIKIKDFLNTSGLTFSKVRASFSEWFSDKEKRLIRNSGLFVDDSNFGKAQFFQTDFHSFKKVVFQSNMCTEISTSLVKWFTPEQLDDGREEILRKQLNSALSIKDEQQINIAESSLYSMFRLRNDTYRQLKFASQKEGNIPQALEFQRHEMDNYRKIIASRKPRNWSEHLILWSNQTNDFGQDWMKAFGLFIIFSFISFIPVAITLNAGSIDPCCDLPKFNILVQLKNWLVLMNPAHRMSDLAPNIDSVSDMIYLWDILSRIIVSYFIFQIVSAFRKFHNR